MFLEDVLKHRTVQAADPLLRAAPDSVAGRQVRWVHSSEVLDIAPLLRGGELLLSGGQALATATDERRVDYVRELAGVALPPWRSKQARRSPTFPSRC